MYEIGKFQQNSEEWITTAAAALQRSYEVAEIFFFLKLETVTLEDQYDAVNFYVNFAAMFNYNKLIKVLCLK